MNDRIGCKIYNGLPWHSQKDIASFFGKTVKTISEHSISSSEDDTALLICKNTEGKRAVTRTIKHYSFNYVAGLCYRIKSIQHTKKYKAFLSELGIVWPDRIPIPCDEKNFAVYLSEIFKGLVDINFEYRIGPYRVDGYIKSLNLVLELDGAGHENSTARANDIKREECIKNLIGAEIIRAPIGDFTSMANVIISRLIDKK